MRIKSCMKLVKTQTEFSIKENRYLLNWLPLTDEVFHVLFYSAINVSQYIDYPEQCKMSWSISCSHYCALNNLKSETKIKEYFLSFTLNHSQLKEMSIPVTRMIWKLKSRLFYNLVVFWQRVVVQLVCDLFLILSKFKPIYPRTFLKTVINTCDSVCLNCLQ